MAGPVVEEPVVEEPEAPAASGLARLVGGYRGSRYGGLAPGTHRGLPTYHLDLIVALGAPVHLAAMPDPSQPPGSFTALVAGLQTAPAVTQAWHRIVASGGTVRVGELAAETGYSRQHLTPPFRGEFGVTPKQLVRIVRFERSARLLRELERSRRRPEPGRTPLAEVAARCGYYDQAHLAREWSGLAGCPPSAWLATEELPFLQAGAPGPVAGSVA